MLGFGSATRVYVAIGATDMRKGFEGLFGIVRDRLMIDPLSGHVFVFCNARKNRLKILYWDGYVTLAIMRQRDGRGAIFQGQRRQLLIAISHNSAAVISEA
jgi:transposase